MSESPGLLGLTDSSFSLDDWHQREIVVPLALVAWTHREHKVDHERTRVGVTRSGVTLIKRFEQLRRPDRSVESTLPRGAPPDLSQRRSTSVGLSHHESGEFSCCSHSEKQLILHRPRPAPGHFIDG